MNVANASTMRPLSRLFLALALGLAISPSPAHAAFSTRISSVTSPVYRGSNATARVTTAAGARCSITVTYKSGPSSAKGLSDKTASSKGAVIWTWKVGSNTTPGRWPVDVTCSKGRSSDSDRRIFEVRRR